jgi:DNA-directed RNA polymerase specialized sigma24 family protein
MGVGVLSFEAYDEHGAEVLRLEFSQERDTCDTAMGILASRFSHLWNIAALESYRDTLRPSEHKALYLRFVERQTYHEVGKMMGLSRQRVHQLVMRGLRKLPENTLNTHTNEHK